MGYSPGPLKPNRHFVPIRRRDSLPPGISTVFFFFFSFFDSWCFDNRPILSRQCLRGFGHRTWEMLSGETSTLFSWFTWQRSPLFSRGQRSYRCKITLGRLEDIDLLLQACPRKVDNDAHVMSFSPPGTLKSSRIRRQRIWNRFSRGTTRKEIFTTDWALETRSWRTWA